MTGLAILLWLACGALFLELAERAPLIDEGNAAGRWADGGQRPAASLPPHAMAEPDDADIETENARHFSRSGPGREAPKA